MILGFNDKAKITTLIQLRSRVDIYLWSSLIKWIERNGAEFALLTFLIGIFVAFLLWYFPPTDPNKLVFKKLSKYILLTLIILNIPFLYVRIIENLSKEPVSQSTTVNNLLACLGNTGGEQRHIQLFGCLEGVSLPATTTAQQIIDILGTIPRDSTQWHDALVDLLKNNKITISGKDATRLLSAFGSEQRRSSLIGILCHIKRPIPDSDKNELLKGIDPMYVSYVRQQLAEPTNPPCEN